MLGSTVKAAAEAAGFRHVRALSWDGAVRHLTDGIIDAVLIDLELDGFDATATRKFHGHVFAGYGSHVRTSLFEAAAAAGIEHLFTRGELHGRGADRLRGLRAALVSRTSAAD